MIEREVTDGIVTLCLAHGKVSALDLELCDAITEALRREESSDARAVILTGTDTIFSAGVDLFRMTSGGADYVRRFFPALSNVLETLFRFRKPAVAAVNGHAIAGGCILAAACDSRLMSGGRIGVPELLVGVPFPAIAIEIVRFAAGRHTGQLVLTGRTLTPEEAQSTGLVDEVVAAADLPARAHAVAEQLASIDPENFAIAKRQLRYESEKRIETLRELDARNLEIWCMPETHAAIRAYLERTVRK